MEKALFSQNTSECRTKCKKLDFQRRFWKRNRDIMRIGLYVNDKYEVETGWRLKTW